MKTRTYIWTHRVMDTLLLVITLVCTIEIATTILARI